MTPVPPRREDAEPQPGSRRRRRRFLRLAAGNALGLTLGATGLAGCGGSSGGEAPDEPPIDPSGPPLGTVDETVAAAARIIEAAGEGASLADTQSSVLAVLARNPSVSASGRSAGGVWAVFDDGLTWSFIFNRSPEVQPPGPAQSTRPQAQAAVEVPDRAQAVMLNGMGDGFYDVPALVRSPAQSVGYAVRTQKATVATLSSIGQAGFVLISGHGDVALQLPELDATGGLVRTADGKLKLEAAPSFVMTTAEDWNGDETKKLYSTEFLRGEVGGATVNWSRGEKPGSWITKDVVAVSHRFVQRHWRFARDALVWIDACQSSAPGAAAFIQACHQAAGGAALHVGWSDDVIDEHSRVVVSFVIDRLLGANDLAPLETPPQRSFDYVKVYDDLRRRGLHRRKVATDKTGTRFVEILFNAGSSSRFGLLAPTIERVTVNESPFEQSATLIGTFGTPPADKRAVLIGGLEAAVRSWSDSEIVCELPLAGTGSSGEVVVMVRGLESNRRRITEWAIPVRYEGVPFLSYPNQKVAGTLLLRFRADVGDYRLLPGRPPVRGPDVRHAYPTIDSGGPLTASGSGSNGVCTGVLSGAIDVGSWIAFPVAAHQAICVLRIDLVARRAALGLGIGATSGSSWIQNSVSCPGGGSVLGAAAPYPLNNTSTFPHPTQPGPLTLPTLDMTIGDGFVFGAGELKSPSKLDPSSYRWDAVRPLSAPDTLAAQ